MAFQSKHSIEEIEEKLDVVSPEIVEKLTRFDKIRSEKSLTVNEIYDGTNQANKALAKDTAAVVSMDFPLTSPITFYDEIIIEMAINSSTGTIFGQKILYLPKNIGYNPSNTYTNDAFNYRETIAASMAGGADRWQFWFHLWFKNENTLHLFKVFTNFVSIVNFKVTSIKGIRFSGKTLDPLAHVNSQYGIEDTPVGHIMSFMGTKPPKHYLICDGSILNKAEYPYLADLFEDQFGMANYFGGDGTTTIQLPDLRNQFLRGYHGNAEEQLSDEIGMHQNATKIPNIFLFRNESYSTLTANYNDIGTDSQKIENSDKSFQSTSIRNFKDFITSPLTTYPLSSVDQSFHPYAYNVRSMNVAVLYCIKYEPTYFVNVVDEEVILWQNTSTDIPAIGTAWNLSESCKNFDYLYFEAIRKDNGRVTANKIMKADSIIGSPIELLTTAWSNGITTHTRAVLFIYKETTMTLSALDSESNNGLTLIPWRIIGIRKTIR